MTTPKKIPVGVWAAANYDPPPSAEQLSAWARQGEFQPPAEKVGREWYVRADAVRVVAGAGLTLVQRLRQREPA